MTIAGQWFPAHDEAKIDQTKDLRFLVAIVGQGILSLCLQQKSVRHSDVGVPSLVAALPGYSTGG